MSESVEGAENAPAFTGQTELIHLHRFSGLEVNISDVRFTDGSVTNWHSHEGGQVITVVEGKGHYCERDGVERSLVPGDVVIADPGVDHWHGAVDGDSLRHITVSHGLTTWKEAPELGS